MRDPLLELQVFYEIAMSIGNSIDMQVVLQNGVKAYLRKLNVQAGAVFALTQNLAPDENRNTSGAVGADGEDSSPRYAFDQLYAMPRSLDRNDAYRAAMETLAVLDNGHDPKGLDALLEAFPIYREVREDLAFVLFPLEGFGALLLIARPERIDENLRHSLRPINAKLAQACIACRNAGALKAEVLERKRSEHSLAESEEQLRLILRSVQAGIVVIDEETQEIVEVNAHARRLLGRSEEDLIGKGCHGYIFPIIEDQPVLRGDSSFSENHESELLNPVRGRVPVIQNTNDIVLKGRRSVVSSFVDVGAIRKAASERQRLELLLLQSQKMEAVGLLAGGIAHDFNNLLNVILNYNELAMDEMHDGDPAKEDLREVRRACNRASELTRQLLAFSRKQVLKPVPLDLNQVASQFERMLRRLLPEDINLVLSFAPDLGVVRADPGQIEQVLLNLAVNARDAMPG
ncbi:MAG: PAS domain S-box protein, partial [Victivallales bacterium]|nr:PAS domain S-box protein [Victivallales bacterium]